MKLGPVRRSGPACAALALAVLGSAFGVLWSARADAQGVDEFGAYGGLERAGAAESPQHAALELRFGRYVPQVDSEFGATATPFEDTFGGDSRYLIGLEVDWQALRIASVGTLGPGFGWGYTKASADAPIAATTERSDQRTTLTVMPMYLVGVFRADVLARETPIPLVGYVKGGLGYALWWVSGPDRLARDDDGVVGKGSSYGPQFALGGMLLLDFMDEESAIELDNATGMNNSYFFVEWYVSDLDCFGGDCMQVGANTWMLGLALEI
jgi:hypothetical protein